MPVISCDYISRPFIMNGKLDVVYSPVIPIKLSANHKMYPRDVKCLLDSGAETNLMPADIGENLGLNVKKGKKREHWGIGSIGIVAYTHPVKIFVERYSFKTEVDFSYDHRIPLLGRYGFFKHFKTVTFNEARLRVDLSF